jgi:hypothetical protein
MKILKYNKTNFSFYVIIIIIIIILFIILILYTNYYYGKKFKPCKACLPNEYGFIDVNILPKEYIELLEKTIRNNGTRLHPELNFNNAKGKKLNYTQLPIEIINFYNNDFYRNSVSNLLKENVYFADNNEKYKIFSRLYEDENDFLDWHYDNNFTIGDRYTLVIPVLVDNGNTSEFVIKDRKTGYEKVIHIPIGKGVVYNGSITYHKITPQSKGNRRMVVVIPFYTNYKKNIFGVIREYFRNVIYRNLSL